MNDFNDGIIREFRANGGKVGRGFEGAPLLLLHTTGAKSGKERIAPVMYLQDGERVLVFASKAGAVDNPDWYHNILAEPRVSVEVGTEAYEARAEVVTGDERDRLYARQAQLYPGFAEYEEKTDRVIPVVALERLP